MPSNWDAAERIRLLCEVQCPKCHAQNIQNASPTIEVGPYGSAACNQCGHTFLIAARLLAS